MDDWSKDLADALASGDPEYMNAMLAKVPDPVLCQAIPYIDQLAATHEREGRLADALSCHDQLVRLLPDDADHGAARARVLIGLKRHQEALAEAVRVVELAPSHAQGLLLQAQALEALDDRAGALKQLHQARQLLPDDETLAQRVQSLEAELAKERLLRQTLNPDAPQEPLQVEMPPLPEVSFDPALFGDPSIPDDGDTMRVEGLRRHLRRYSDQLSPRTTLTRLQDPTWLSAWDTALSSLTGLRVAFRGSELGVFALRALHHGAQQVRCLETGHLDARIAGGMAQKHFLPAWHARHGEAVRNWSEEERQRSFEQFISNLDVVSAETLNDQGAAIDCLVFPQIDHSLLGTGIVHAIRQLRAGDRPGPARILPGGARVYAMAVQWCYPGIAFDLEPLHHLRWSPYPQPLDLDPESWQALTKPVLAGTIDFNTFEEARWALHLPVTRSGRVDAIVYWFELDLGDSVIGNAPDSPLRCIRSAVQYTDPFVADDGTQLEVEVQVDAGRLYFHTCPPARTLRSHTLPSWYVPMLGDRARNDAYREALGRMLAQRPAGTVFDIGAGCGLLSLFAAEAGADRVVGCEHDARIAGIGREIVASSGFGDRITIVGKDCRGMQVPDDLPARADLAVFELFDCSLIGEGILHFLAYARQHLLTEDARFLPASARIRAIVIEHRFDRVLDIDAGLLNPYLASPAFINVDASRLPYRALTDPFDVFAFDFANAGPEPQECELSPLARTTGTASAVLFWFDLQLDEQTSLSNQPGGERPLHWKQGLQFLPEVRIDENQVLPLSAGHDGSGLGFRWRKDALAENAWSRVPRMDPRWLAASSELDRQNQELMQHCAQNPGEFRKVAAIAQRFAVDPASHGLDPTIAQRFALMLLNAS